jgi:hypothetical protein
MIGSIGSFNRDCRYCNRPITMRLIWYGWYGRWHAFERAFPNRHYCDAYRVLRGQPFQLERGVLPTFERPARQKAQGQRALIRIAGSFALAVLLAIILTWLRHN